MFQSMVQSLVGGILSIAADFLFPLMFIGFGLAIALKALILASIQRQLWFAKEFEKRVVRFLSAEGSNRNGSFYHNSKKLLEVTYYQLFELRAIMMRRKLDYVHSPLDRLFGTQTGCAVAVRDTLQEVKYLNREKDHPDFLNISKSVFNRNPYFSKLFAWLPLGSVNEIVNLIPGLFIIGGIFGTFLGIMEALPELSQLNLRDPEASKLIMDTFLLKISFSISTSIIGILFSVLLTMLFALMGTEKKFLSVVDSYHRCLARMWDFSLQNNIDIQEKDFDEHRDPIEALAELAVDKGVKRSYQKDDSPSTPDSSREVMKKVS